MQWSNKHAVCYGRKGETFTLALVQRVRRVARGAGEVAVAFSALLVIDFLTRWK